jgi:hypothetical protein
MLLTNAARRDVNLHCLFMNLAMKVKSFKIWIAHIVSLTLLDQQFLEE